MLEPQLRTRDWRTQREEMLRAEQAEAHRGNRNDAFRSQHDKRIRGLHDLLQWPGEARARESAHAASLSGFYKRKSSERQKRIVRRNRIEAALPLPQYAARRFVRMARSFQFWLDSTCRSYGRPYETGPWAELGYDIVEAAVDRERSLASERQLSAELDELFKAPDWWLGSADKRGTPDYLLDGTMWNDLFDAAESPGMRAAKLGMHCAPPAPMGERGGPALGVDIDRADVDIMQALRDLGATAREELQPAHRIAKQALNADDSGPVKARLAALRKLKLVGTKRGRDGGSWLTPNGLTLINRKRPKTEKHS